MEEAKPNDPITSIQSRSLVFLFWIEYVKRQNGSSFEWLQLKAVSQNPLLI